MREARQASGSAVRRSVRTNSCIFAPSSLDGSARRPRVRQAFRDRAGDQLDGGCAVVLAIDKRMALERAGHEYCAGPPPVLSRRLNFSRINCGSATRRPCRRAVNTGERLNKKTSCIRQAAKRTPLRSCAQRAKLGPPSRIFTNELGLGDTDWRFAQQHVNSPSDTA